DRLAGLPADRQRSARHRHLHRRRYALRLDRGDPSRACTSSAGEREAGAALPSLEANSASVSLRDIDVDALRERAVRLDSGSQLLDGHRLQVVDEEYKVRIADID